MSQAAVQDELKTILRGLLISSPQAMTVNELQKDYKLQEGQDVPFSKFGFKSFLEYIKSVPDTVAIQPSFRGGSPIVVPVQSDKSSHIDILVQKQKLQPPKRAYQSKFPRQRLPVKLPPETNSRNYIKNYNNSDDVRQKLLIPYNLQQRIYKMLLENPQGVPVQTIEQELCSMQTLRNYGIYDGGGVYQLLNCLNHFLKVSKGMVYPLQNIKPVYRPKSVQSVIDCRDSNISNSGTCRFLPAGCESCNDIRPQQNGAVEEDNELECKVNSEDDASISEEVHGLLDVGDVWTNREKTEEGINVILNSKSPIPDICTYNSACTSDIISERMKLNLRLLLDKYPGGIWCSELPHLYKEEFRVVLDYVSLGFVSVIQMASNIPDVFHCIKPDGTDWKLFDAQKKLPSQYSSYDIKSNKIVSTKMFPSVPSKVKKNIVKLLTYYSNGIPSDQLLSRYMEVFLTSFSIQEMGFDTMESFLLSLNDTVLHMRYVNKKILVYPHAYDTEPELGNPLPHITEPQDPFPDLYKPEVVGPKGTIPYENIPPETAPGGFLEVLVAEVYTPQNFWILLRGEKTHLALDRLMNDIQEFYNQEAKCYHMPDVTIRIGQYCMAPFNKEWHRACITAVHNLTDAQVLFVDYGTSSRVKKNELLFMHQDFSTFPVQAIKASLVNLMPADGAKKWPYEVNIRFLELVSDKNLIAVVSSVDHEARRLEVALVDTCGDEDVHINDVLVKEGLAEYKTNKLPSPPPQRIEADLAPLTVTVSRPPPGFSLGSKLWRQSSLSPTGSTLPEQTVTEIRGQSHLQSPVPNKSVLNVNASNFIPQSTSVPVASPLCDISMLTNTSLLQEQASLLQQFLLYDRYLQHQHLMASLMMPNPTLAYLVSQHTAAALANQYGVPRLNPPVMCTPTAIADRMENAEQLHLNILQVCPTSSPNSSLNEESLPPIIDKSSVSTKLLIGDSVKTSDTGTKECLSVTSPGVSYSPFSNQINPQMCIHVHSSSQPAVDSIASQKEVTVLSQVRDEEKQNKFAVVSEASNNTVCTEFTYSTDTVQVKSHIMKSDPDGIDEQECMKESGEQIEDLSFDSDEIYRSDDDSEQEQWSVLEPHYVKEIEIARRTVHLINVSNTAFLCTEEVIRLFTDFRGRHVVLKMLDARQIIIPFHEIGRNDLPVVIDAIEAFNVVGVPKNVSGYIQGKVHLIPLKSVPHMLTLLNVQDRAVLRAVQEEIEKFDPNDIYWTGNINSAA